MKNDNSLRSNVIIKSGPKGKVMSKESAVFSFPPSGRDSPSSSTSTSRLLSDRQDLSSPPLSGPRDHHIPHYPYSLSRHEEPQDRRGFVRKMPSPVLGDLPRTRPVFRNQSHTTEPHAPPLHNHHQPHAPPPHNHHRHPVELRNSDVFLPSDATSINEHRQSIFLTRGGSFTSRSSLQQHARSSSLGAMSYLSRASSSSDVVTPLALHQSVLADQAIRAPRISRSSSRRSNGEEWTRYHWHKIKDLEETSERARRCSKLSSGFAPLMIFGGLVFVCIGISASTNTGKDKERLKNLSAAPLVMGVFMIVLGTALIITWFACRARAHKLDKKLLHGSPRHSASLHDNIMQSVVSKFYDQIERSGLIRGGQPPTPAFTGVAVDAVVVHKTPASQAGNSRSDRCHQCGMESMVTRETSV